MTGVDDQRVVFFRRFSFSGDADFSLAVRCGVDEWPRLQTTMFFDEPQASIRVYVHKTTEDLDIVPVGGIGSSFEGPYSEQDEWDVSACFESVPDGLEPSTVIEVEVQVDCQLYDGDVQALRSAEDGALEPTGRVAETFRSIEALLRDLALGAWERLLWRQGAWGAAGWLEPVGRICWLRQEWDEGNAPSHAWVPIHLNRAVKLSVGQLFREVFGPTPPGRTMEIPERSELGSLMKGPSAPLGHNLLREAQGICGQQPRAAWVIAVAAMESGLKECIADLEPDTSWLDDHRDSPSLRQVLVQELPRLSSRIGAGTIPKLSSDHERVLKRAIKTRNQIVHGGRVSVSSKQTVELVIAVRKLLYFLDYHRGQEWAEEVQ